jgi:outer membrane receptor protein involved in Fe transport
MSRFRTVTAFVLACLMTVGTLTAQGVQTGVLTGFVRAVDGAALPGATVTAVSPSIQGERSTVSDGSGAYVFHGLTPGTYEVAFDFPGLQRLSHRTVVALGGTAKVDAVFRSAAASERVVVTVAPPSLLSKPTAGLNLREREVETLPTGRTPSLVAELAPGLTNNTPNSNQVSIAGAFAFDNVFMIDGVDINDNLLGNPDNLFIEEAVDETQVLTAGVSAEYGRFAGGVINMITRRGGNAFSGSVRSNLSNPAWTAETPFEKANNQQRLDKMDRYYEGVFGGPVRRDKVWFFFAARSQNTTTDLTLAQTAVPFVQTDSAHRAEIKVTATPWLNQTVQGQYTARRQSGVRPSLPFTIDPNAPDEVDQPGSLLATNWNGVLSNRLFATAQYSRKQNHPRFGGTSTALVDSPFLTIGRVSPGGLHFNAPYFDRTDAEDRDNHQLTGSLSWFGSNARWGTHDVKSGYERFVAIGRGGNSQSSTGYIFNTDYLVAGGRPVFDATGRLIPVWIPGSTTQANSIPTRGAQLDITTTSFYTQDRWTMSRRLTLDLGLRYERVRSKATGDIVGADTNTWMPRIGATLDLDGEGRTVASATYGHYAGKYVQNYFNKNTVVGNAARVTRTYNGPAGQGLDFAPAFDPANYTITSGSFPTANVFFADDLSTALTREMTVSIGRELGDKGVVRATYVLRNMSNFIETFVDDPTAAGRTSVIAEGVSLGTFDNVYYRNSDAPSREYRGVQLQGNYRAIPRLTVAGHWTIQLRNNGNFEGESANNPGIGSVIGDYPELAVAERNFPEGRLDDFQRHKVRVWAIYNLGLGKFGSLDIAPLWRYNSALTYSIAAANVPLSAIQREQNPGYARLPGSGTNGSQTLFYGERGSEEFAGYGLVDLGVTYQVPLWRAIRPFVEFEALNMLNNDKLIGWDTTVTVDPASALDAYGLPSGYLRGARFGQGTSTAHYPRPRPGLTGGRTFLGAVGIRF